ncbi:MAG: DUF2786 domain-containing protein [Acidimicrobiia bacterium]|nr:DUF2786 domain-containing protein [Acidimicrobiia bacterium]MDH4363591.1 DUF2786 domain-containing protein [Acidimicrobiia bacterium]
MLDSLWGRGWLPGEVLRQVERTMKPPAREIAALAIAVDLARRPPGTVHRRWAAHVAGLGLTPPGDTAGGWLRRHHQRLDVTPDACGSTALTLFRNLDELARVGILIPPPGSDQARAGAGAPAPGSWFTAGLAGRLLADVEAVDASLAPVLTKVRALLAQAESTTFDAEAATFTAKAQELMARHAIDTALLWGRSSSRDDPTMVRLPVDEPYLRAKTTLLHVVAARSSCRSVYYPAYALVALIGFGQDLLAAETLYTSLLVQAQQAVQAAGAAALPGAHERSRGFRSSFLHAYAHRVGQRLAEVNDQVRAEAAAGGGADLLPVLADRAERVEAWMAAELGPLRRQRASSSMDASGWAAGSRAANRADLGRAGSRGRPGPSVGTGGGW